MTVAHAASLPPPIVLSFAASDPTDKEMMYEPTASKIYRHPTFYEVPDEVGNM